MIRLEPGQSRKQKRTIRQLHADLVTHGYGLLQSCGGGRARVKGRPAAGAAVLPLLDLVGVDAKLLCQFRQRLLALDRGQRRLRLESRRVVPAGPSCHLGSRSQRILRRSQAETPLIPGVQISRASSDH